MSSLCCGKNGTQALGLQEYATMPSLCCGKDGTQSFLCATQALYQLSTSPSP